MEEIGKIYKEILKRNTAENDPISFKVHNSEEFLRQSFEYFIGADYQFLPEYKRVVSWMENNKGLGMILYGSTGRGKTVISQKIMPVFFKMFFDMILKTYSASEMNKDLDLILDKRLLSIDDIGTEEQKFKYGEKRWAFPEVIDSIERNSGLIIVSTNLSADLIEKRYGIRTRERIRACCFPVMFTGASLRK